MGQGAGGAFTCSRSRATRALNAFLSFAAIASACWKPEMPGMLADKIQVAQ